LWKFCEKSGVSPDRHRTVTLSPNIGGMMEALGGRSDRHPGNLLCISPSSPKHTHLKSTASP
jgi:hypothetical protein